MFTKVEDFKKTYTFNDKLHLDERDNIILTLVQKNPEISQDEIAKQIKLSQPSVGARIKKLKEKGILHIVNGVNFKIADLSLAKIDVYTTDTTAIIKEFTDCPFFINALITSGRYNLCLFFMSTDLKTMEGIVNFHLRSNPKVKDLELNIVIATARDFVLPLNLSYQDKKSLSCNVECISTTQYDKLEKVKA